MLLAEVLVKGVMESVGMSLATFCFFVVPFADGCFLLLSDTKAMWNGIIEMDGNRTGRHTIQPNHGCAMGAIYWTVGARVGLGCR